MIPVPSNQRELQSFTRELVEQCQVSVSMRAAYCRLMSMVAETGRYDGTKALINTLYKHLDRTAAHLFSPVELKFSIDFENPYQPVVYERAKEVARILTRQWNRNNTDVTFGRGVFEALKYGACILKQWPQIEGADEKPTYYKKLVMPWQFGVYDESETDINLQPALCETTQMTLPAIWRRIWHLPNAQKLYDRIKAHASTGQPGNSIDSSMFNTVLSTSQLNTTGVAGSPIPGGILQINNGMNYSVMGPQVAAPTVTVHEVWVQDETDYTTIIMVEPDVIIAPLYKKANLLVSGSGMQPYTLIQPNEVTNWFWGRSELVDLIEPQSLLATTCDDLKRLFGLQVDKIIGFTGDAGVTDETYGQFREAGWLNMPQGADIKDITPKIPPEMMPFLKFLLETINNLSGFPPIMQGQGEAGVRAGSHATTLMKTASPTLRDRALLVERQCAIAADLSLAIREAKDSNFYWTQADDPIVDVDKTKFLISQLPDDWRVNVDSHSSSPIFSDENTQLVFASHKMGIVDGEYVIDNVSLPEKEAAKTSFRLREKRKAENMQQMMKQFPEMGEKLALKQITGAKR